MIRPDDCTALAIVLVDDEASFRTSLAEMLREDGHDVLDFGAPGDMPELEMLGRVDLLITDYDMPGRKGVELADDFHARAPRAPVILLTGYRTEAIEAEVRARPFIRITHKPIDYAMLHGMIHDVAGTTLHY